MAITTIGGSINSTAVIPNLDYKYGPYNSLQEAYDALGPEGADKLVVGLTVGIIQQGGGIVEYWFKDGTNFEDLVMKIGGSNEVDYQGLINKPSINSVVLSGNKTSSDLDLYTKPATGIPSTDLSSAVQTSLGKADISVSNTVNDLVNYYLKTETYTQTEVNNLIGAIHQFHFEVYPNLVSVTDPSSNVLYLIGPSGSGSDMYEEYVYANNNFVKIGDTSIDLSGYVTTTDLNTALAAYTTTTDLQTYYAQKDGEYNELHSGYTKWIEGNNSITDPDALFTYRPSHNNFITQYGVIEALKGNSVVVNQLIDYVNPRKYNQSQTITVSNGTFYIGGSGVASGVGSYTNCVVGHKYYIRAIIDNTNQIGEDVRVRCGNAVFSYDSFPAGSKGEIAKIVTAENTNYPLIWKNQVADVNWSVSNFKVFDLTLMGIDNLTTTAEVEAWLASNIGLRDYYPYNAGTIINSKFQGLKTIGFNRFNVVNNTARLPVATNGDLTNGTQCYQITGSYTALEDEYGNAITPNSAGFFNISKAQTITISGGDATTCVHLTWSGDKNGEYEEYWTETKEFDVTKIYGKLNGEGEMVQVFPEGMRKAGSVHDILTHEKAVKNTTGVNLGNLTWSYSTYFSADYGGIKLPASSNDMPDIISPRYVVSKGSYVVTGEVDKSIGLSAAVSRIFVNDSSYTDATIFKTAMSGVMLNYALATPLTYTNLVYRDNGTDTSLVLPFNYRVDDYGSEEQLMPTPVNDEITSCACYLDLEYDIVRGIDFIKDTSDRLSDIDNNIQDLRVPVISQVPVSGMLPNVVYNLGTLGSNTTFTLATPTDNTILNHWYWTFNIGSTIPTIVWPSGIIWAGDNLSPIIEANKHYEVSVINNIGTYIYSVVI